MVPSRPGYAMHFRSHSRGSYSGRTQVLASLGLGLCPVGGEARALDKSGAPYKHKRCHCHEEEVLGEVVEEKEEEEVLREPREEPGRFEGLPWPDGAPLPPDALSHPFEYSNGALTRTIPRQCLSGWADVGGWVIWSPRWCQRST